MDNSEKDPYGLLNKISKGMEFKKFTKNGDPYRCSKWQLDRNDFLCMYYTFSSHEKRIPLSEIEKCVHHFKQRKELTTKDFSEFCPIAIRSGGCAFAVIGGILEKFFGAEYKGHGRGFRMRE